MGQDIFDCLLGDIEPASAQEWPPVVHEVLEKLRSDEALRASAQYGQFVNSKYKTRL